MNINLLLCEKADDQVRNINNIFDKIIFTNRNKNISFEILTIINQLDEESKEFILLYFIEECNEGEERLVLYLGQSSHKTEGKRNNLHYHSISRFIVDNCSFPEEGDYEVKVYMQRKELIEIKEENTETMLKYANEDNLVATCPFKVEYK